MSVVIKAQAFQWFLPPSQPRPGQTDSDFGSTVMEIIGMTLDVEAKFKSRRKKCLN
jgi:hypothetical protein